MVRLLNKHPRDVILFILAALAFAPAGAPDVLSSSREKGTMEPINAPFAMPQPLRPSIPEEEFDIRSFGAVEGGLNSDAIRRTIEAAVHAGGGHVLIPAGTWLTGAIHLDDNIDLHLSKGAELLFSQRASDYLPVVFSEGGDNIIAFARVGRGAVLAVGDPWFYNAYMDQRKLPEGYDNARAASNLFRWLLQFK